MRLGTQLLSGEQVTWAASTTKKVKLPQDRFIRKISLMVKGNVTTGATAPAADAGVRGIIDKVRIVGQTANGTDTLVDVNFNRYFKARNTLFGTPWYFDSVATASQTAWTRRIHAQFDFAVNPTNELDMSALVPAHLMSSFSMFLDTPSATSQTNLTVNVATTIDTFVEEVYLTGDEERDLMRAGLLKVYVSEETYAISGVLSNYTFRQNLPVGGIIQRMTLFTENASDVFSDDIISQYRIWHNVLQTSYDEYEWYESKFEDQQRYALEQSNLVTGMTVYDAEMSLPGVLGLDARGMKVGDLQLHATTLAAGDLFLVYERVV